MLHLIARRIATATSVLLLAVAMLVAWLFAGG
jgi:hypothetical protein